MFDKWKRWGFDKWKLGQVKIFFNHFKKKNTTKIQTIWIKKNSNKDQAKSLLFEKFRKKNNFIY